MIENWKERTELLLGKEKAQALTEKHIVIFGLGGVGAYAAESLCRAGIGELTIIDSDVIVESNKNRQIIALSSTIGKDKTDLIAERLLDINPRIKINKIHKYFTAETISELFKLNKYDYIVDAIDTLQPKIHLIKTAYENNLKIISSMGAGGKFDPTQIRIADISKSYNCKKSRMIRKKLHKHNIYEGIKVVFTPEETPKHAVKFVNELNKKTTVGTISYMPAFFGLYCSYAVLDDLTKYQQ